MAAKIKEERDTEEKQKFDDCQLSLLIYLADHNVHLIYLDKNIMVIENDTNKIVRSTTKDMLADFFKAEQIVGEQKHIKTAILSNMDNASGMNYYPAFYEKKEFIDVEGNAGIQQWNTFMPNYYTRQWYNNKRPREREPYMFPRLEEYLSLFFETPEAKKWFIHRLAATIKEPKRRLPTSLILHGVPGSGKDTLRIILERVLGKEHVATINGKALQSDFNSYIPERVIVFANEVFNWEKRQDVENVMKDLTTNDRVQVNRKYTPEYHVDNYCMFIFATNSPEFVPFDESDRRYSYITQTESLIVKFQLKYDCGEEEALGKHVMPLIDYIKNVDDLDINDEFYSFYCYLMDLKIDWEFITKPLWTMDKEGAIRAKFSNNPYYRLLKRVLKSYKTSCLLYDVKGHIYVDHKRLFEDVNDLLPEDKKFESSHKFTIKAISMGLISKPATKTIHKENKYFTEIISKILVKDVFEEPKPIEFQKGTLKEKKENDSIPVLDNENKSRFEDYGE